MYLGKIIKPQFLKLYIIIVQINNGVERGAARWGGMNLKNGMLYIPKTFLVLLGKYTSNTVSRVIYLYY